MAELESTFSKVLLSLQICLAFWQIVKLTVFGAFIKAFMSRCMSMLPCGLGTLLSPSYCRLKKFDGFLFFMKFGACLATTKEADEGSVTSQESNEREVTITYLERREGHKLFVDEKMAYYITDPIWHSLLDLKRVLLERLITGGVMDLSEVLECLILRNHIIKSFDTFNPFLPVNLSVSEEKVLKGLNLVGLFLQTKKKVYWLIPTLFSFTSAVMEFITPLREWIYTILNRIFCRVMHPLCDHLPLKARLSIYSLLEWVENMKPCNDIEWRVVRGVKHAVIGGAKACLETASLVQPSTEVEIPRQVKFSREGEFLLEVELIFDANEREVRVTRNYSRWVREIFRVHCDREDKYKNLRTFVECLVKSRSGSLESCEPNGKVCRVRSFQDSVLCYSKNGFPQVYQLELDIAVVK